MCDVRGCKNPATKNVTLTGTLYLDRKINITEPVKLCDKHWSELNGGNACSMGSIVPLSEIRNFNFTENKTGCSSVWESVWLAVKMSQVRSLSPAPFLKRNYHMCDVSECKKESTKKVVISAKTTLGTITREVSLCDYHWKDIQDKKYYSMGCSLTPDKE